MNSENTSFHLGVFVLATAMAVGPALAQQADPLSELPTIEERIEEAQQTIAQFDGGAIQALAQYRLEVLRLNRALIENRALGDAAGLTPELVIPSVEPDPDRAAEILADIKNQQNVIETARREAETSGGLVQALALSRLETEKLTLAQLRLAWLQAQYGIATPQITAAAPPEVANPDSTPEDDDVGAASDVPWADPDHPEIDYAAEPFPSLAESDFRFKGWFAIQETRAAVDDSPKVLAINFSAFDTKAFSGQRRLLLQCVEGTPSVVYNTGDIILSDFQSNTVPVVVRIDDAAAENQSWNQLTNNKGGGLFGERGLRFIRSLYDADTLFLRAEGNRGREHDARFDLAGVKASAEAVAAACGVSLLALNRDDYRAIQTLLNNAGFDTGTPDGIWGSGSQAAMKAFQEANDLPATGAPDRATLEAIGISF